MLDGNLEAAFASNPGQEFALEDVLRVYKSWTDNADEPGFIWLVKLNDGRWGVASGGCDYTGWD